MDFLVTSQYGILYLICLNHARINIPWSSVERVLEQDSREEYIMLEWAWEAQDVYFLC